MPIFLLGIPIFVVLRENRQTGLVGLNSSLILGIENSKGSGNARKHHKDWLSSRTPRPLQGKLLTFHLSAKFTISASFPAVSGVLPGANIK